MKNILLFVMLLLIITSCTDYNKDIEISVKLLGDNLFADSEFMSVTTGKENFWRSESNKNLYTIKNKEVPYNSKSVSMPTITESGDITKVQVMFEVKKEGLVTGRGITVPIDVTDPKDRYNVIVTPINQFISLTPEILGTQALLDLSGFTLTSLPNGKILIWGGERKGNIVSNVFLYNPEKIELKQLTLDLDGVANIPRAHHSAVLFYKGKNRTNPRVLISGGVGTEHTYLKSAVIFNPETEKIEKGTEMLVPRAYHSSAAGDVFAYVIGGKTDDATYLKTIENFNPANESFTFISDTVDQPIELKHGLANATAMFIGRNKIIIAGGNDADNVYGDMYELTTNGWTLNPLSGNKITPRAKPTLLFDGSIVYYVGGFSEVTSGELTVPLNSFDKYDPFNGKVMSKNYCENLTAQGDVTASLSLNNKMVVLSGDSSASNYKSGDIINLDTCATNKVSLNSGREGGKAILTKTGQVLVIGGKTSTTPIEILSTSY